MRISVFGATGMAGTGTSIVAEALARGHSVTAWSHRLAKFARHERLTAGIIDLNTPNTLGAVLGAADATVLTVLPTPGDEHQIAPWTAGFLDAAATTGTRVLVAGGAGPLISPNSLDLLIADDPTYVPAECKAAAQASVDQLRTCQHHPYNRWVYLSPAAVFAPGRRIGSYERGTTRLLVDAEGGSRITPADLAIAAIDELENPGRDPHFTVAQAPTVGDGLHAGAIWGTACGDASNAGWRPPR